MQKNVNQISQSMQKEGRTKQSHFKFENFNSNDKKETTSNSDALKYLKKKKKTLLILWLTFDLFFISKH